MAWNPKARSPINGRKESMHLKLQEARHNGQAERRSISYHSFFYGKVPTNLPHSNNMEGISKNSYFIAFDKDSGIASYSAYRVNAKDARNIGKYSFSFRRGLLIPKAILNSFKRENQNNM